MTHLPTPSSIAATICAVTASYTFNLDSERTALAIDTSHAQRERRTIPVLPNAEEAEQQRLSARVCQDVMGDAESGGIKETLPIIFRLP